MMMSDLLITLIHVALMHTHYVQDTSGNQNTFRGHYYVWDKDK